MRFRAHARGRWTPGQAWGDIEGVETEMITLHGRRQVADLPSFILSHASNPPAVTPAKAGAQPEIFGFLLRQRGSRVAVDGPRVKPGVTSSLGILATQTT
jgi:hypothetical protein